MWRWLFYTGCPIILVRFAEPTRKNKGERERERERERKRERERDPDDMTS